MTTRGRELPRRDVARHGINCVGGEKLQRLRLGAQCAYMAAPPRLIALAPDDYSRRSFSDAMPLTPSEILGLEAGTIVHRPSRSRHFHDTWQIAWTHSGAGEYCTLTHCFTCPPDAPVLIAPGEIHSSTPAGPWAIDTLYVPDGYLAAALGDVVERPTELVSAQFTNSPRLTELLRRVQTDITGRKQRLSLDIHFLELVAELAAHTHRRN